MLTAIQVKSILPIPQFWNPIWHSQLYLPQRSHSCSRHVAPVLAPGLSACMAPKSLSRGIQKRSARPDAGAGGRQKAPLPDKFFLSYPKAVALVTGKLTPVYQGGWAVKRGSDYFIYWYVRVEGEWTASSGAAVPNMSSMRRTLATTRSGSSGIRRHQHGRSRCLITSCETKSACDDVWVLSGACIRTRAYVARKVCVGRLCGLGVRSWH